MSIGADYLREMRNRGCAWNVGIPTTRTVNFVRRRSSPADDGPIAANSCLRCADERPRQQACLLHSKRFLFCFGSCDKDCTTKRAPRPLRNRPPSSQCALTMLSATRLLFILGSLMNVDTCNITILRKTIFPGCCLGPVPRPNKTSRSHGSSRPLDRFWFAKFTKQCTFC